MPVRSSYIKNAEALLLFPAEKVNTGITFLQFVFLLASGDFKLTNAFREAILSLN